MLSDSYVIDVTYTCGDGDMTVEAWFVKVNTSLIVKIYIIWLDVSMIGYRFQNQPQQHC